jgi:cell wall-associated NlpC family hydrolase
MNQVYLKKFFLTFSVMLFFNLKTNQKLMLSLVFGAMLFASCSGPKKATATRSHKNTHANRAESATKKVDISPKDAVVELEVPTEMPDEIDKAAETKADKVISTARTFIGTPYKYGGMTRSGMDCSGLLINSFTAVKVSLPRSSEAQSKVGTEIKMHDLQPGDLVFFATGNKKNQITHVGLITDVRAKDDIKFIHASSSLGVVETNLFAEYYQKRFRAARRVIE